MGTDEIGATLGPTARRVAANVRQLRDQNRVSVRELSQRLRSLGKTVHPSGVSKTEQGTRRIDADDLVALALALGVSPNRLLLDPEADDEELALTTTYTVTRITAWNWATGEAPLPAEHDDVDLDLDALGDFQHVNRPNEPDPPLSEVLTVGERAEPVVAAIREVVDEGDVTLQQVMAYLRLWATHETAMATMKAAKPRTTKKSATRGARKGGK